MFSIHETNVKIFQGDYRRRPRCEGERNRTPSSTANEGVTLAEPSARNVTLSVLDEIIDQIQIVASIEATSDNELQENKYNSETGSSIISDPGSQSEMLVNKDRTRKVQNTKVVWKEPIRTRKIQTTSLLLRRKRNGQSHRERHIAVLRLRGGASEANEEENRRKPVRRFSTGQMNISKDCIDGQNFVLQRSSSAPQLSIDVGVVVELDKDRKTSVEEIPLQNEKWSEVGENEVLNYEEESFVMDKSVSVLLEMNVLGESVKGQPAKHPNEENLSEFGKQTKKQSIILLEREASWRQWELDRQMLRPPPLASPRLPEMEYVNMTVDDAENEDGIEHYDLAKDAYRRTDAQVQMVRKARRDQREVAGGIYQCQEEGKESLYLHIMKGPSSFIGIKLVHFEPSQKPRVQFETFGKMEYERYVQSSSHRVRVNLPEETDTGFIWYGHGGSKDPLSSSVYKFCERVDNDMHYSAGRCERITQAPGASQLLCSNESCGIIFWHLSVIFFHCLKRNHFEEAGQEHFAVMLLRSGEQVLLWTDKADMQTRWKKLEHSPCYEKMQVWQVSRDRVRYVVAEGLLPECNFSLPAYSPIIRTWDEPRPFRRIPSTSTW